MARLAIAAVVGVAAGTALGAWIFRGSSSVRAENERLVRSLDRRIEELEKRVDAPAARMAVYPSVEQLRAARTTIDRKEIARVSAAFVGDRETGLAMVRFHTFDEILQHYGAPSTINAAGNWYYERPEGETLGPETLELDFVNGYVVYVHSTDE